MSKIGTVKGPGIFLAQFAGDVEPFNSLGGIAKWANNLGYKGIQIPTWDGRFFDLKLAASSKNYCDEIKGICHDAGVVITELSSHLQGQLVGVHPSYDMMFDGFAVPEVRGNPKARQEWAVNQLMLAAMASKNLGIDTHVTFSGALAWPYLYPWPPRPPGLVEAAFDELAKRWLPIFDAFDEVGCNVGFELHPGEDLHDGITFEMFLERVNNHPRCGINYDPSHFLLQQLDYLQFIDIYHQRIYAFHVKDAEFTPSGKQGVYSGFQNWVDRAGRFRSLGDGQVDFSGIFSRLAKYGYEGWAVLEWECAIKHPEAGAAEGAPFIKKHIIQVTEHSFDDFAGVQSNLDINRKILGIG
jgi:sugar phosphate isomerase/epimerase